MPDSFLNELRHFLENIDESDGWTDSEITKDQAKRACAFARKRGLLVTPDYSFDQLVSAAENSLIGSEHIAELDEASCKVIKITLPEGFGLKPSLIEHCNSFADIHTGISKITQSIEYIPATPLEYLSRWESCNLLFGDQVELLNVIQWKDGRVSFTISQPQYHGTLPSPSEIETYFEEAGWSRIPNTEGHAIFYNYSHSVLAADMAPRNCYLSDSGDILPFDVILSSPDSTLEEHLDLY